MQLPEIKSLIKDSLVDDQLDALDKPVSQIPFSTHLLGKHELDEQRANQSIPNLQINDNSSSPAHKKKFRRF